MLLLKLFSSEQYLNDFLDGNIYCNSASIYRTLDLQGIGDRFESCQFFAQGQKQLDEINLTINGYTLTSKNGTRSIKISSTDTKDYHLHCWFSIVQSDLQNQETTLTNDFKRMCEEFGGQYIVVIPPENLQEFLHRMSTNEHIGHASISYSSDSNNWSHDCKNVSFSYQREFRFFYTPNENTKIISTEAIIAHAPKGFRDIAIITNTNDIKIEKNTIQEK